MQFSLGQKYNALKPEVAKSR